MSTYGEIRLSLSKQVPGLDPELISGFILDAYQAILDEMSWERIKGALTIQSPAEVNAGTITVTLGNQLIIGNGTAWNPAMTGSMCRISGGPEFYQFTFQSATVGLLDRPYEGTAAGAGVGYKINQTVFALPTNVRLVESVRNLDQGWELGRLSSAQLNVSDPQRIAYGAPAYWAPTFDQFSSPPTLQIELNPVPDRIYGVAVDCVFEDVTFGTGSSTTMQVWMRPACLKAAARALCEAHLKDWNAAEYWNKQAAGYLMQMVAVEAMRIGPQQIRMADRFTRKRLQKVFNTVPRIFLP